MRRILLVVTCFCFFCFSISGCLYRGDGIFKKIVSNTNTDNSGAFNMTGLYSNDYYTLEVDSPDYFAQKTIMIEPSKNNWHEIFAIKR